MDGQNQKPDENPVSVAPHSDLAPDEAISLRAIEQPLSPQSVQQPAPAQPAAPVTAPAPPVAPIAPVFQQPVVSAIPTEQFANLTQTQQPHTVMQPNAAYAVDEADDDEAHHPADVRELTWTASEFIAHPKSMQWYLILAAVTVAVVVLAFVLTKHDFVAAIVIAICGGLFGYAAGRAPRQLQYGLGTQGISIGQKFYPYSDFRSFVVVPEGAFSSVDFMPLKRFAPVMSMYYDPEHEPHVMEILSQHLPVAAHKRTWIDELMMRIRF